MMPPPQKNKNKLGFKSIPQPVKLAKAQTEQKINKIFKNQIFGLKLCGKQYLYFRLGYFLALIL